MFWFENTKLSLRGKITFEYQESLIEFQLKNLLLTYKEFILKMYECISLRRIYYAIYKATLMKGHHVNLVFEGSFPISYRENNGIRGNEEVLLALRNGRRRRLPNLVCITSSPWFLSFLLMLIIYLIVYLELVIYLKQSSLFL